MKKWIFAVIGMAVFLGACSDTTTSNAPLPYNDNYSSNVEIPESNNSNEGNDGNELTDVEGEELFTQSCASCHGGDLQGDYGPGLLDVSEEDLLTILIENPDDDHEGLLSEEEAETVSTWILSNNSNSEEDGGVTDINSEELFTQSCASCHGGDLQGDYGPGLLDVSEEDVLTILINEPDDYHEGLFSEEEAEAVSTWITEQ